MARGFLSHVLTDSLVAISTPEGLILLQQLGSNRRSQRERIYIEPRFKLVSRSKPPYWFDGVVNGWLPMCVWAC